MSAQTVEVRSEGKTHRVPSIVVGGQRIVIGGGWLKLATVHDEELIEGVPVGDPELAIRTLQQARLGADLFTFSDGVFSKVPRHSYFVEPDNAAIISITDYEGWEKSLSQDTRRNIRRAAKHGVVVKPVGFDDDFVRGVVEIYNETPVRQGRRFWHYGKGFDAVKVETATYSARSEFIGAFFQDRLIGFMKLVYVGNRASILHILSMVQHSDKRPTNALIAKAVELCAANGHSELQYCKYVYGKNERSPLTEFKRRNGFQHVEFPRFYVPLTHLGKAVLALKLHHGLANRLPSSIYSPLVALRRKMHSMTSHDPVHVGAGRQPS